MGEQPMTWLQSKFEYFLVSFWMLVFVCVVLYLIHGGTADSKALDWSFNAFSALLGALLGLIQGHRMGAKDAADQKPEGEVQPK